MGYIETEIHSYATVSFVEGKDCPTCGKLIIHLGCLLHCYPCNEAAGPQNNVLLPSAPYSLKMCVVLRIHVFELV